MPYVNEGTHPYLFSGGEVSAQYAPYVTVGAPPTEGAGPTYFFDDVSYNAAHAAPTASAPTVTSPVSTIGGGATAATATTATSSAAAEEEKRRAAGEAAGGGMLGAAGSNFFQPAGYDAAGNAGGERAAAEQAAQLALEQNAQAEVERQAAAARAGVNAVAPSPYIAAPSGGAFYREFQDPNTGMMSREGPSGNYDASLYNYIAPVAQTNPNEPQGPVAGEYVFDMNRYYQQQADAAGGIYVGQGPQVQDAGTGLMGPLDDNRGRIMTKGAFDQSYLGSLLTPAARDALWADIRANPNKYTNERGSLIADLWHSVPDYINTTRGGTYGGYAFDTMNPVASAGAIIESYGGPLQFVEGAQKNFQDTLDSTQLWTKQQAKQPFFQTWAPVLTQAILAIGGGAVMGAAAAAGAASGGAGAAGATSGGAGAAGAAGGTGMTLGQTAFTGIAKGMLGAMSGGKAPTAQGLAMGAAGAVAMPQVQSMMGSLLGSTWSGLSQWQQQAAVGALMSAAQSGIAGEDDLKKIAMNAAQGAAGGAVAGSLSDTSLPAGWDEGAAYGGTSNFDAAAGGVMPEGGLSTAMPGMLGQKDMSFLRGTSLQQDTGAYTVPGADGGVEQSVPASALPGAQATEAAQLLGSTVSGFNALDQQDADALGERPVGALEQKEETNWKEVAKTAVKAYDVLSKVLGPLLAGEKDRVPARSERQSDGEYMQTLSTYVGTPPSDLSPDSREYFEFVKAETNRLITEVLGQDPEFLDGKTAEELAGLLADKREDELQQLYRAMYVRGQLGTMGYAREGVRDEFSGREMDLMGGEGMLNTARGAFQQGLMEDTRGLAGMRGAEARGALEGMLGRDVDIFGMQASANARKLQAELEGQEGDERRKKRGSAPAGWVDMEAQLREMDDSQLQTMVDQYGGEDNFAAALQQLMGK